MANHLADEKSPYLEQHVDNPVDWYPWGEEAFRKARELDRPIFLSIGYSTCHWCHVMAHESFEDEQVARKMNEVFISIKVDREERPDIDSVYMKAAMLATGKGGWPLSIFMTAEKEPFFTATYIPRNSRYGMAGFIDLIDRIDLLWNNDREELLTNARDLVNAMKSISNTETKQLEENVVERAFKNFNTMFDQVHGGFGNARKFPSPHQLMFLLRYYQRTGNGAGMIEGTLDPILAGGINDHVGGGFHRYSTDREWLVPHFEKMLYDQAMLVMTFTEAYLSTKKKIYKRTVERTVDYVLRDLRSDDGLFYSAENADSEGVEGNFYVWDRDEILRKLGNEEGERFCSHFNVDINGNFHDGPTGRTTGKNILHLRKETSSEGFEEGLEKLRNEREERIRPSRDEKVLTDWNALMISSLARAGQAFSNDKYIKIALSSIRALETYLGKDGRWFHRYMDGERKVEAMLDDLAFLSLAYLDLYEATFDVEFLVSALKIIEEMIEDFHDTKNGGFYQTSMRSEELISREKGAYDGAMPSGNSAAAWSLIRASRMTGRTDLEEIAYGTFNAFSADIERSPTGFSMMLSAYIHAIGPSREIVIAGDRKDPATGRMIDIIRGSFLPDKVVLLKEPGKNGMEIERIAPFTKQNIQIEGRTTAYVCQGWNCDVPTTDPERLRSALSSMK